MVMEWRRNDGEQDVERFLIALAGPLALNSAHGGLHCCFNPSDEFRDAVIGLLEAAGVENGRPSLDLVDVRIDTMIHNDLAALRHMVPNMRAPCPEAVQRVIDMAARASGTRSLIIMKDNTAEALYNAADDYGLCGLGCGQGPALYQRMLTLVDYPFDGEVYDGVGHRHEVPAFARRHVVDLFPWSCHKYLLFYFVLCLRVVLRVSTGVSNALQRWLTRQYCYQTGATVIRLTSHPVKFLLLDRANQILHNIATVTGADVLTSVLLGKLPITALTMLADKGHTINKKYRRQLKWLKPSKWIDSCGSIHDFMLQISGTSDGRRDSLVTFVFVVALHEGALKYCSLYKRTLPA